MSGPAEPAPSKTSDALESASLGEAGRDVVDATTFLIEEELRISERLEKKAREYWQLVSFAAPLAITGTFLVAKSLDVSQAVLTLASVNAIGAAVLLMIAIYETSEMSDTRPDKAFEPDVLRSYVRSLSDGFGGDDGPDIVRGDLARRLINIAESRTKKNAARASQLKKVKKASMAAAFVSVLNLVFVIVGSLPNG